jgi:hypothetical protein
LLLGYERDMPTPPSDPGSSPFVSAAASRAASIASIYEDSHERLSSTGLDGAGYGRPEATRKHGTEPALPPSTSTGQNVPSMLPGARSTRPLVRKARRTFASSLGHSIAEE